LQSRVPLPHCNRNPKTTRVLNVTRVSIVSGVPTDTTLQQKAVRNPKPPTASSMHVHLLTEAGRVKNLPFPAVPSHWISLVTLLLHIEMWEFETLQDMEKCNARIFKNKEMKRTQAGFHTLIEHATFARFIWNTAA
jgi:hypothetical protein